MLNKSKKGFTIVELIIVIAVIAVLAAVLIPTFSNLIGKAQEAKDTALVRNLNEALAMDTSTSKHTTMEQAVAAVRNNGIDISKIKATVPGNAILWDSVNDLFAYYKVDKDGNASGVYYIPEYSANKPEDGRLFAVVSDVDAAASSKYGVYYIGEDTDSITVKGVGFDAGSANIGEVVYQGSTNGVTVDIRTNGGKLTVKAPKDTVNHYGTLLNATIEQVDKNSYHEYGTVEGTLYLNEGRVKVENGASVSSLVVTAESLDNVKVESVGTLGAIAATKSTVASGLKNNANIAVGNADVIETEVADAANNVFAGGLGTEKSPYLIANENQFVHIGDYSDEMKNGKAFYFKLIGDVDLNNVPFENEEIVKAFTGTIDGNGYTITAKNNVGVKYIIMNTYGKTTIKNLELKQYSNGYATLICYPIVRTTAITFENITISPAEDGVVVNMENNNASSFIQFIGGTLYFKDCKNNVDITSVSYCGIFIGGYSFNYSNNNIVHAKVSFVNCENNANVTGKSIGFFTGSANQSKFKYCENADFSDATGVGYSYAYVENCSNNGVMIGTQDCGAFSRGNQSHIPEHNKQINDYLDAHTEKFKAGNMTESGVNDMALIVDDNNEVSITKSAASGVAFYQVDIYASTSYKSKDGTSPGSGYIWIKIEIENVDAWKSNLITKIVTDKDYGTSFASISGTEKTDIKGHKYKEVAQQDGSIVIVVDVSTMLSEFGGNLAEAKVGKTVTYQITTYNENGAVTGAKSYKNLSK